jgi:uncharacterized protein (UPF0335 family)
MKFKTKETAMSDIVSTAQITTFVERIERISQDKQTFADDIKQVYAEAKSNGFDTKAIREIVKLRKIDANARQEQEAILDLYKSALNMA